MENSRQSMCQFLTHALFPFHCLFGRDSEPGPINSINSVNSLSLGRVFQLHTLCWLQASFRDIGQNSVLRRPVDSATLGLKSACKKPPNGFKGAHSPAASQACDSQTSTRRLLRQLAALLSASEPLAGQKIASELLTGHFYRFRAARRPLLWLPSCSQAGATRRPKNRFRATRRPTNCFQAAHRPLLSLPSYSQVTPRPTNRFLVAHRPF